MPTVTATTSDGSCCCPACFCATIKTFSLTFIGISPNPTFPLSLCGPNCTFLNSTFTLVYNFSSGSTCFWAAGVVSGGSTVVSIALQIDGSGNANLSILVVDPSGICSSSNTTAIYTLVAGPSGVPLYDCNGSNVFNHVGSTGNACVGWPPTLTVF